MPIAYYMTLIPGESEASDRVGFQPKFLPVNKAWDDEDDEYMALLLELEVDGTRIDIEGAKAIQLYQDTEIDSGADPLPQAVLILDEAPRNLDGDVKIHPDARAGRIDFQERIDPEVYPAEQGVMTQAKLFTSKLGGLDPWEGEGASGRFLGLIHPSLGDFNFADMACGLYLNDEHQLEVVLR